MEEVGTQGVCVQDTFCRYRYRATLIKPRPIAPRPQCRTDRYNIPNPIKDLHSIWHGCGAVQYMSSNLEDVYVFYGRTRMKVFLDR